MNDFMDSLSSEKERIARERVHAAAHEIVNTLKCFDDMFNVQLDGVVVNAWTIRLNAWTFTGLQLKRATELLAERDIILDDFVVSNGTFAVSLTLIVTVKYL